MQHAEDSQFFHTLPDDILASIYAEVAGESTSPSSEAPSEFPTAELNPKPSEARSADLHRAACILASVDAFVTDREQHLSGLLHAPHCHATAAAASAQSSSILRAIAAHELELQNLSRTVVLDSALLWKFRTLHVSLKVLRKGWELMGSPHAAPVALVIREQPLPHVVFKGKPLEPYTVHALRAPFYTADGSEVMEAHLCTDELPAGTVLPATLLENEAAKVDPFQHNALFADLKLALSTRMAPVTLRFRLRCRDPASGAAVISESEPSNPMISITNESQWADAAGKLLLADAFEGATSVPFPHFANTLHAHFIAATRQDAARPARPLSDADWAYIHAKFFNSAPYVRTAEAQTFWAFFGPALSTLRFKRHIVALWCSGLIFGFANKETCNALLSPQELGSFVIRFSESIPGLFTVAYVSDDPYDRIKHYLVKPEDISLNKTLPDLLREKPQFQHVLQLDVANGSVHRYPRDAVFSSYFSKNRKPLATGGSGYVAL